jgi:hypothetical protein
MADSKDNDAPEANAASAASDANAASNSQPSNETSKAAPGAASDAAGADAKTHGPFLPIVAERITPADFGDAIKRAAADGTDHAERWQWPGYPPVAATIALAAVVGALAGAAATAGLQRDDQAPIAAATNQALQDSVEKFGAELAALKAGLGTAQRSAHAQFGKLAERLDRSEKAQSEPAAKIAKIAESLDRVERRIAPAAPEITGSVPAAKQQSKPPLADGWRLRDFYAGRAVVESRSGRLFEVGPGSNLPGLGRVETIKREDGQVVVVTRNGIIAASLQPRRLPRYLPYLH